MIILLHGRNAGPRNILELAGPPRPPGVHLSGAGGRGQHLVPVVVPRRHGTRTSPCLSSALRRLDTLVDQVEAAGVPRERIVLLGFSQGACLTAEFAVRHAGRYGGLIVFSGGLIGPPGTTWDVAGDFAGTPVFLGCSDVDAHVPKVRVEESAAVFARMGAATTIRIYPGMGHLVNDDEIAFARTVMAQVAG